MLLNWKHKQWMDYDVPFSFGKSIGRFVL